jgi:hypothetical protein
VAISHESNSSKKDEPLNATALTNVNRMPSASNLSRPIVALKNLMTFSYRIKKIEIVEETGIPLNSRNIENLSIYPVESEYWILFTGKSGSGLPLPLQDLKDVKKVSGSKGLLSKKEDQLIEFSFSSNKFLGGVGKSLVATIKVDDKYVEEIVERLRALKRIQYDVNYWEHHSVVFPAAIEPNKSVDIYPNAPFLADGEEMIWQHLLFYDNDKREIIMINAITNYRVFQYNYEKHQGIGILFPLLQEQTVSNQRPTLAKDSVGNYFIHSYNLAGIKEASTSKVVGDISFRALDKPSITFTQITDPETLSTAVRRLKEKHSRTSIDGKEEKIIPETKVGFVRCSACENENPLGSKFCNKCGSALSVSSCNKCGQLNIVGAIFCSNCGSKFH